MHNANDKWWLEKDTYVWVLFSANELKIIVLYHCRIFSRRTTSKYNFFTQSSASQFYFVRDTIFITRYLYNRITLGNKILFSQG